MAPTDDLKGLFAGLTDEELVAQLAEGRLAEQASVLAREELVSRGANVDLAVSKVRAAQELESKQTHQLHRERWTALRRIVRFPLGALLGVESPWLVLLAGAIALYLLYRGTFAVIAAPVLQRPLPSYALPISYITLAIFQFCFVWLAVSLWRCARRSDRSVVVWFMRVSRLPADIQHGVFNPERRSSHPRGCRCCRAMMAPNPARSSQTTRSFHSEPVMASGARVRQMHAHLTGKP
jgi:hypothetical protein